MIERNRNPYSLTDPYTASSLLQKAIRRGETELAIEAARLLVRFRGRNAWRRLLIISFEDVGLGSIDAASHLIEFAGHHLTGSSTQLSDGLERAVEILSTSPKSRSADHLFCSATWAIQSRSITQRTMANTTGEVLAIAGDPGQPLVDRAAALLDCHGRTGAEARRVLNERVSALRGCCSATAADWAELSLKVYRILKDPFVLTLPLLLSALDEEQEVPTIQAEVPPPFDLIGRLPSYVFDKHTAVGKKALTRLSLENSTILSVLEEYVAPAQRASAVCMAGFYVDAVSLNEKFVWPGSAEIERKGLKADMNKAGCPCCGINLLLDAVADNIDHLNWLRRELTGWRAD